MEVELNAGQAQVNHLSHYRFRGKNRQQRDNIGKSLMKSRLLGRRWIDIAFTQPIQESMRCLMRNYFK